MTKLVRNDALSNARRGGNLVQVCTEVAQQGLLGTRAGQQSAIWGQRIERTEESETLDQFTHERVYWDHSFGLQLAEGHMNGPLVRACGVEAIEGKVGRFADAHAGVAQQQEYIGTEIIAVQQFLLKELILLHGEGAGQASRSAGNILATEQLGELGKLCAPRQFLQNPPEEDQPKDVSNRCQGWGLGAQFGHPAEDVWITAQLIERTNLGIVSTEIGQEVTCCAPVLAGRFGSKRGTDRIDSASEQVGQGMRKGSLA